MTEEMKKDAVSFAKLALLNCDKLNEMAFYISTEFKRKYSVKYGCAVGITIGICFQREKNKYYFNLGIYKIIL